MTTPNNTPPRTVAFLESCIGNPENILGVKEVTDFCSLLENQLQESKKYGRDLFEKNYNLETELNLSKADLAFRRELYELQTAQLLTTQAECAAMRAVLLDAKQHLVLADQCSKQPKHDSLIADIDEALATAGKELLKRLETSIRREYEMRQKLLKEIELRLAATQERDKLRTRQEELMKIAKTIASAVWIGDLSQDRRNEVESAAAKLIAFKEGMK